MKKCTKCGEEKPLEDFVKNVKSPNGYRNQCMACCNALATQNRRTRRARLGTIQVKSKKCTFCERILPSSEYHSCVGTKDSLQRYCKSCLRDKRRVKRSENPEHYHERHLQRTFGMTLEEFQEIEKKQNYRCAICGTDNPGTIKRKGASKSQFCVDHDHITRKVRGLLCSTCNAGIGLLGDNLKSLEAAAAYLREHHG